MACRIAARRSPEEQCNGTLLLRTRLDHLDRCREHHRCGTAAHGAGLQCIECGGKLRGEFRRLGIAHDREHRLTTEDRARMPIAHKSGIQTLEALRCAHGIDAVGVCTEQRPPRHGERMTHHVVTTRLELGQQLALFGAHRLVCELRMLHHVTEHRCCRRKIGERHADGPANQFLAGRRRDTAAEAFPVFRDLPRGARTRALQRGARHQHGETSLRHRLLHRTASHVAAHVHDLRAGLPAHQHRHAVRCAEDMHSTRT